MTTIIIFILILGLLVFVHELGHFLAARKNGVAVHEFGFGFPPRICGFRKVKGKYKFFWSHKEVESEDTIYSMNWIPLGGFVRIKGEQGEQAGDADSFASKPALPRFIILIAGVVMNFLLAFILLTIGFTAGLPINIQDGDSLDGVKDVRVQILDIQPDSAADSAGIELGDTINAVNGVSVSSVIEVQEYIKTSTTKTLTLEVKRGNTSIIKEVTPQINDSNTPIIGVSLVRTGIKSYPWYEAIWQGARATVFMIINIILGLFLIVKNLLITHEAGVPLAGPVGIAVLTGRVAEQGFSYLLQFIAILSVNLGVINLLPFPALDGGRILFLAIEKIRKKPVSQNVENIVHMIGFALLLLLMVVVTFKDVARFW